MENKKTNRVICKNFGHTIDTGNGHSNAADSECRDAINMSIA